MEFFLPAPFLTQNSRPCQRREHSGGEAERGGRGWGSGRGWPGWRVSVSQGGSVAVTQSWSWARIKPRYAEGEGHPLAKCDFGKNVWCVVGKELVCRTPGWGITDAGPMRPCGQRPARPRSGWEEDSAGATHTPVPPPPNQ